MFKKLLLLLIVGLLPLSPSGFAQNAQSRISQSIVINGQQAQGVLVVQNGTIQSQSCASPQHYMSVDGSSSGWACFEQATGTWLLQARPAQQAPTIVYSPTTTVYLAPPAYSYPYPYNSYSSYSYAYPYVGYPYFVGSSFGFGLGYGFGYRSPIVVGRRSFIGPIVGRSFVSPRSFGGFRRVSVGRAFGRSGRR